LWALSYLSDGENDQIDDILKLDIAGRLIELLKSSDYDIKAPALRCIGNLLTGEDEHTEVL